MEQVNTITDLGFVGGKHLYHLKVTGLVLDAGVGTVNMPCDQIQAIVGGETTTETKDDYVLATKYTTSGNVLSITVKKMQVSDTNTWGAAGTEDVSESVYSLFVLGL
jgi:hypothetical protein